MKLSEMKNLSRDEIIKIAVTRIKESYPDFEEKNYDIRKVLTGKDVIKVRFNLSYIYVPKNSYLHHDMEVSFYDENQHTISCGALINPEELDTSKLDPKFFKPDNKSKKAIEFVKEICQKEGMKIVDPVKILDKNKAEYFEVTVLGEPVVGGFKINKKSKKVYDKWHKELLDHLNLQNQELKEIK